MNGYRNCGTYIQWNITQLFKLLLRKKAEPWNFQFFFPPLLQIYVVVLVGWQIACVTLAGGPANRGQTGENFLQGDVGTEGGHP